MARRHRIPGTNRKRGGVVMVLPSIPDDAPDDIKNGLAIRNACATEGRCPACGVRPALHFDRHGIGHLTFRHEEDCPCLREDGAIA